MGNVPITPVPLSRGFLEQGSDQSKGGISGKMAGKAASMTCIRGKDPQACLVIHERVGECGDGQEQGRVS
jgi:hypothetical protein